MSARRYFDSDSALMTLLYIAIGGIVGGSVILLATAMNYASAIGAFGEPSLQTLSTIAAWQVVGTALLWLGVLAALLGLAVRASLRD